MINRDCVARCEPIDGLAEFHGKGCPQTVERVTAAAILLRGEVHTASRHSQIIARLAARDFEIPVGGEQGFVTNLGRFVGREEAARVAIEAGQIERLPYGSELYSEWVLPLVKEEGL